MQEPVDSSQIEVSTNQPLAATAQQAELKEDQELYFIPSANIPLELALLIFSFLDVKSWRLAALVCRSWHLLANDPSLWRSQEAYYKQGNLWRYLFREPNTNSYQKYFTEVFQEPNLDCNNVFVYFRLVGDKELESLESSPPIADKQKVEKIKILISNYFGGIDFDRMQTSLIDLHARIEQLLPSVREKCLEASPSSRLIEDQANRSLALALLVKTHSLDVSLIELLYLNKLRINYMHLIKEFIASPIGKLYENKKAIQLLFALRDICLTEYAPTTALVLLGKLSANELVECAQYCLEPLTLFILGQSALTNSVDDNQLFTLFSNLDPYWLRKNFIELLEKNRAVLPRLNADFLIRLCKLDDDNKEDLPFLILTHPVLIHRLSLNQITDLIKEAEKLESLSISNIFKNVVFQQYVLNQKDPRDFLLSLPPFRELYELEWTAKLLTPKDALNAMKIAFNSLRSSLPIAEAVANQKILLAKFSGKQLVKLASKHSKIALLLLRDKMLVNRWQSDTLRSIKQRAMNDELQSEIEEEITKVENQQKEYRRQQPIKEESRQLEEPYKRRTKPETPNRLLSSHIDIARQLNMSPSKSATPASVPESLNATSANRQKEYPQALPPRALTPARAPESSKIWPIAGLIGLGLLFSLGILLLITGFGGVVGVPLLLTSLAAINTFPISASILCLGAFVAGGCTTTFSATLIHNYCTHLFSKKVSLKGQTHHFPRSDAPNIPTFRQQYSPGGPPKKVTPAPSQEPNPGLCKEVESSVYRLGPR